MTADIIGIILYILIAAAATFALLVASVKAGAYDPEQDEPWPILCAILWPVGVPIAAAFIAANWFLNSKE